ncbi:DUF397 domain-containing protein [Amycolatopsis sp. NPDC048633]|uniref:DUF397 domain-containing protein n=1 Tax=Amycolatopsis sp. NPDC048633 TaxID=3157095 RepID=UPI00340D125D
MCRSTVIRRSEPLAAPGKRNHHCTCGCAAIFDETAFAEVAFTAPAVAVRDSKDPSGPHFAVDASAWLYFLTAVTRTG